MAPQSALETYACRYTHRGDDRQIRPVKPMRLVLRKEARAKPIDRMQYRIPGEYIAAPAGHHSRHVEDSRPKIQCASQLRPDLIPRLDERVDDGIDKTNPATEQRDRDNRCRQGWKIMRQQAT